jgi:hypothetical protein
MSAGSVVVCTLDVGRRGSFFLVFHILETISANLHGLNGSSSNPQSTPLTGILLCDSVVRGIKTTRYSVVLRKLHGNGKFDFKQKKLGENSAIRVVNPHDIAKFWVKNVKNTTVTTTVNS